MKPTFIGVGGQKCASSWLHTIFADHPETYVSDPKELNFFSATYDRGHQWYEHHFSGATGRAAIGEISPSYLPDRDAPARARHYNPDFRILVALRDPVERAYSNHLHDIRLGYYHGEDLSFEAGLSNNPMYVEQSRYAKHLATWLDHFPREQFLVLFQEEIAADPLAEARRVYEFLGVAVDHVSGAVQTRANESYLPKSRRWENFIRRTGALTRQMGFGWVDRGLRRLGVVSALHQRNRSDIRQIVPPISELTRSSLIATLGPDTLRLAQILDRTELPWRTWRTASGARAAECPQHGFEQASP
jgi:hypothetical protein